MSISVEPWIQRLRRGLPLAAAASLALPVAISSVALVAVGGWFVLGGDYRGKWLRIRGSRTSLAALLFLAVCLLGVAHGSADWASALERLQKYSKLLLVPMLVTMVDDTVDQRRALDAVLLGALLALAVSYLRLFGVLKPYFIGEEYSAFHDRIGFGVIEAFAAFVMAARAWRQRGDGWGWGWGLGAALAAVDVLMVNTGRTGWVVLFALLALLWWQRRGWRGLLVAGVVLSLLGGLAFALSGVTRLRVRESVQNLVAYAHGSDQTSVGERLNFDRSGLRFFLRHPLLGSGTGSYAFDYRAAAGGGYGAPTDNPHDSYLLVAAEQGVVGLLALLSVYAVAWRESLSRSGEAREVLQALVVTLLVSGLFNSSLLDAASGRLFVVVAGILLAVATPGGAGAAARRG